MIRDFAYSVVGGLPVAAWTGLATLAFFLGAAAIMALNLFTAVRIPVAWHPRLAVTGLVLAIFHMVLALSAYLSY